MDVADEEIEPAGTLDAERTELARDKEPAVPDEAALRQFSRHSKDDRTDPPQVVIAMAVAAEGVPIRCWSFPWKTLDQLVIRRIKDDLGSWMLNRVLWVADSGFNSATNRAFLQQGSDHYIVCEKLRPASADAKAALSRSGRYHLSREPLGERGPCRRRRFWVCVNPEARARDEIVLSTSCWAAAR